MLKKIQLSLILICLCSCSHQISIHVRATEDLNSGGNPVVIRIYQLKSDVNFQSATLENFWNEDVNLLGSDLTKDPIEMVLYPEDKKDLTEIDIEDETAFIAAAANFYNPDINKWRYIFPIKSRQAKSILLAVGKDKIAMESPEN